MTLTDDQSVEYSDLLANLGDNKDALQWIGYIRDYGGPATVKLLDLGCGAGGMFFPLHRAGFNVTGVDSNSASVKHIRGKLNPNEGSSAIVADFCTDELGELEAFDAALLRSVVFNYPGLAKGITPNVIRHLRKGGIWLAEVYSPEFLKPGMMCDDTYQISETVFSDEGQLQVKVKYKEVNQSVAADVVPIQTSDVERLSSGKLTCEANIEINSYIRAYIFRRV